MMDHAQEGFLPLREIVAKDPTTALYLPLAERLRESGRVEEAIRLCEERRLRPGSGVGDRIVLGRAYLADGRLTEARAEFLAALSLDRENVIALKALAGILSHLGDHTQATSYYRAVCRVDPGDLESQTALHQITSGEYPEVRPADVIVGQGALAWHPVRLPREEEHLSELALGLHTIETFDAARPSVGHPAIQGMQDLSLDRIADEPRSESVIDRPPVDDAPEVEAPATHAGPSPVSSPAWIATAPEPVPAPPSKPGAIVEGNRSAFELWLRQFGGKDH